VLARAQLLSGRHRQSRPLVLGKALTGLDAFR
jgi:hypothetical protein